MSEPNVPGQPTSKDQRILTNERQVTDPVTHLPITIHDAHSIELQRIPPPTRSPEEKGKRDEQRSNSEQPTNAQHLDMEHLIEGSLHKNWWEDPLGDQRRNAIQIGAIATGAASLGAFAMLTVLSLFFNIVGRGSSTSNGLGWAGLAAVLLIAPFVCCLLGLTVSAVGLALGIYQLTPASPPYTPTQHYREQRTEGLKFDDSSPESAEWLNSFLNSLWPVVNPSLFTSVADILEDEMQATLPNFVHNIRVADLGQGSESVRILGVRWIDAGSAAKEVDGMKPEEGDFVNMEIALTYRAKETTAKGIRSRSVNAHLLIEVWVSGGIVIPVWVDLTGFLATARVRFQLSPNPPFLSMMTATLLGLPKVSVKCTPLAKGFINVMDVPVLSNWIQQSINTAVEQYVAPRSLTLDLKMLLMGREKMDTDAVGVIIVSIKRAQGLKSGDETKIYKSKEGRKGDPYVTVGWSKWGKPLWSTRIISAEDPIWEETTSVLVGPTELNAQEALQLQLWDSDRFTADDLLGTVQVDLKNLMNNKESLNRISRRSDDLLGEKGDKWPGKLYWECGYFEKTTLEQHLECKHEDPREIRVKIEQEAENKLREAKARNGQAEESEVQQQKKQDSKERTDEIVAGSKPTTEWPSGILSITVEQISGLEIGNVRASGVKEEAEDEDTDDLPSAYCTVIINQQRVYKTRTKMKSDNPFYNAGTEKFIRDWTTTDVIIAVRDYRIHEINPIIGIIVLPLREVFRNSSQFTDSLPLIGGIGHGRMKLSLIFRSVQLKLSKPLRGWDVGTLEISSNVKSSEDLPEEYTSYRLVFRTVFGKGKLVPTNEGEWSGKHGLPIRLPVKKRFASCLLIQFRKRALGPNVTPAFCTLWLKEIPDDEEVDLDLPIRKNERGDNILKHGRSNASAEIGERIGTLKLKVRFWSGLSGYHKHLADHDKNMADVMEVLDYAEGEKEASRQAGDDQDPDSDSTSSSPEIFEDKKNTGSTDDISKKDGIIGQFKDFRKRQGELHRKHRGLMQWKAVRNVAWIGRGVENQAGRFKDKVQGTFKHHDREMGIEKEV